MTAVDEFAVGEATAPAASPSRPRRGPGHAARWVAIAVLAIVVGALLAPTTPSRAIASVPRWAGLQAIIVMEAPPGADLGAMARDAVDRARPMSSDDGRVPDEALAETPRTPERVGVVVVAERSEDDPDELVHGITLPSQETIDALAAAAPREDWVCETSGSSTTCTSLGTGVVLESEDAGGP